MQNITRNVSRPSSFVSVTRRPQLWFSPLAKWLLPALRARISPEMLRNNMPRWSKRSLARISSFRTSKCRTLSVLAMWSSPFPWSLSVTYISNSVLTSLNSSQALSIVWLTRKSFFLFSPPERLCWPEPKRGMTSRTLSRRYTWCSRNSGRDLLDPLPRWWTLPQQEGCHLANDKHNPY